MDCATLSRRDALVVRPLPSDRNTLIAYARGELDANSLAGHFAGAVGQWSELLTHGPGFVRVRLFPVDSLTELQTQRAYLGLGSLLGRPVGQDRDANVITHIRDERLATVPGVRKYRTNLRQDFHSDGSDLVGLLCLHPASSGGESKIASAHAVYNEMLRRAPNLVDVMYQPMPWDRNDEQSSGEPPFFELPPIMDIADTPRLFFIAWYIRDSQRHPEAPGSPRISVQRWTSWRTLPTTRPSTSRCGSSRVISNSSTTPPSCTLARRTPTRTILPADGTCCGCG